MKIIDFHVHPKWDVSYPVQEVEKAEVFAEKLVKHLREQRISLGVVLPISPFISNEYIADVVNQYPDRLIGFASVQPNLGRYAIEELEYAINSLRLKGLKLHPHMQGFSSRDPTVWSCIKKAGELGIPVIIHCLVGDYSTLAFKIKPAPWLLTADDYSLLPYICPETTLIYAHMGGLLGFQQIVECASFPNIYLETSYSIIHIAEHHPLAELIRLVGSQKFILGSDYVPDLTPKEYSTKTQVEIIQKLELTQEEKTNIFYNNAKKILKI